MHGNLDFFRGEQMSCRCVSLVDFVVLVSLFILFAGRPGLCTSFFWGGWKLGKNKQKLIFGHLGFTGIADVDRSKFY